jgi:hypothetical protein
MAFVGNPEGRRPLRRPRRRWKDYVKMNVNVVGWEDLGCVDVAQDTNEWPAVVNTVMNCRVA